MTDNLLAAVRQWVSIQESDFTTRDVSAFLIQRFPKLVPEYLRGYAGSALIWLSSEDELIKVKTGKAGKHREPSVWRRIEK